MYQGALYSLLTLFGLAVLFCLIGWLQYSAVALLLSAAVLTGVSVVVNSLLAYCFGLKGHTQSALITGLILTFLFLPASSPEEYIILAFVASLAMASKYLVVWRGRHIFNPAAFGAVAIFVTGLSGATWWVATPSLLIPLVVLGTFLLYRTNRLAMGYLYIITALLITLTVVVLTSPFTWQSLYTIIASYPILFLGYFMLSEPLTQAPRRWQRNSVAVLVAMLTGLQLSVGPVHIMPEAALLIGNFVAFLFTQRGAVRLRFDHALRLQGDQVAYYFQPLKKLRYEAGQYLELTLSHKKPDGRGVRRMFTISSAPGDKLIRIIVRNRQPLSTFKYALENLHKGDRLTATGIYGDFVLPKEQDKKLLFIAGGIGITPFLAQLESMRLSGEKRNIVLLYCVRSASDAVGNDELTAAHTCGLTYHIVTDSLNAGLLQKYVTDISSRHVFISGPPLMVDAAKSLLGKLGAQSITTDQFNGY